EDFSGSHEFRFFGKDHETFRTYLKEGLPLLVKGSFQRNFHNELEPKIKSITYLSNVREDMLKSVSFILPLHLIGEAWMDRLTAEIGRNKGKVQLRFRIVDAEDNQMVNMFSRNTGIDVSNEMLDFLQKEQIEFKVN
ncbi:MAG: hypothetical protein LBS09_08220, partial [Bacteroidales bacterium]|nr:hypothetical protein [Bacteroidales bacterium]